MSNGSINKAYKTELNPTNKQIVAFKQHAALNLHNTVESTEINARGVGKVHASLQVADIETRTSTRS